MTKPKKPSELCNYGSKHWKAKLTENQVSQIRRHRFQDHWPIIKLACHYNVSETCISDIVSYTTWKHVP